ncbi:L-2-hydroxyglutarate dehydrogenase, mitochondrial-like [Dysidea avara]|uniref:L-2-hydroxyglutarate dehydrogenase, mitochondrial-like n=1 Tax=Dysidea avara TaxID=196820 RepID=UPI00331ECB76
MSMRCIQRLCVRITRQYSSGSSYDVAVVGGGIVGLATARELLTRRPSLKVIVLEKESEIAKHQTGHNSGVIHSGIYYVPGSLKAQLCVKGAAMTYDYCTRRNIPHRKCGKLIVAVTQAEVPRLLKLYERGVANGVKDLTLMDSEEMKRIEPHCRGYRALHSPNTGIVNWTQVAHFYAEDIQNAGGDIQTSFEVTGFDIEGGGEGKIAIRGHNKPSLLADHVISCAGLQSDRVAVMSGCKSDPRIVPFRGEYLILKPEKSYLVNGNVYPVPDPKFPFLGVHFTPRMDGSIWLGPNAVLAFSREGYNWSTINQKDIFEIAQHRGLYQLMMKYWQFGVGEIVRSLSLTEQVRQLQRYVPELRVEDVTRGPAGVRAQAMGQDGSLIDDFIFDGGDSVLGKRMLHVRNAPSPGATSSLAIAEMVIDEAQKRFNWTN